MPEIRKDEFVCFVQGHGAKYSSLPAEKTAPSHQRPLSTRALAFARERAAAQLAFQRASEKQPKEK